MADAREQDRVATVDERDSAGARVTVNPAAFEQILPSMETDASLTSMSGNLDLILDVDVPVSVCIGTVRKSIGEILGLTDGHVIDLERSAGEPVDLLVNGKLIARGEVVVVDEHYGIRISEIVAPVERLGR